MSSYLLDTNVLLRLVDRRAPEHKLCKQAVEQLRRRGDVLVLAPQVLVEFWVVATRPQGQNGFGWSTGETAGHVEKLRHLFQLLDEGPELFCRWFDLVRSAGVHGKRAHDARLAAFVLVHAIDVLLTLNVDDFAGLGVSAVCPQEVVP